MTGTRLKQVLFLLVSLVALLTASFPIKAVMGNPRVDIYYTHLPFIPLISALLIIWRRKEIFSNPTPAYAPGAVLTAAGLAAWLLEVTAGPWSSISPSVAVLSSLVFWTGGLVLIFGREAASKARFTILFLLFAVPVPAPAMDWLVLRIARLTALMTHFLFTALGVPFFRDGVDLNLPYFTLVVGPECAGLRSSIALFIVTILAGHFFLKGLGRKLLLVAVVFPLVIIKNSVRIVLLYFIAVFIDERFIVSGFLHRSVGYLVFIMVLILMGAFLWRLEKAERNKQS